jgi:hypothetical protein
VSEADGLTPVLGHVNLASIAQLVTLPAGVATRCLHVLPPVASSSSASSAYQPESPDYSLLLLTSRHERKRDFGAAVVGLAGA